MIRMQTDEVCRLQEFKKVKVSRLASAYLANPSDAAHTGMLHTSMRRNPYHAGGAASI